MKFTVKTTSDQEKRYVEIESDQNLLNDLGSANDLLSLTWDNKATGLFIPASSLSPAFFDLKTGIAGDFLQRLQNYRVKTVFLVPEIEKQNIRVQELARDMKHNQFVRFMEREQEALAWLTSG